MSLLDLIIALAFLSFYTLEAGLTLWLAYTITSKFLGKL